MTFRTLLIGCVGLALGGCSLEDLGLEDERPPIPDDYPQISRYESGAAELVVGGVVLETDGYFSYDDSGVDMMRLRATGDLDRLDIDFRDIELGSYPVQSGEAEASWFEGDDQYFTDSTCGTGAITVVGTDSFDGLVDDFAFWGTIALELCEGSPVSAGPGRLEISGKFSGAIAR